MLDKPTLEIDREKNEVTIKCNGDTIKFKDDNVEVTRASKNMMFKPPDITPQLAVSAFTVLHQMCILRTLPGVLHGVSGRSRRGNQKITK